MYGFNALKQELDNLKSESNLATSSIDTDIEDYERYAEEAEKLFLEQQERERDSASKKEALVKRK